MDFALSLTGHTAGGPGQGVDRQLEPLRHDLRQRGGQRHGRRADHHPADEEQTGFQPAFAAGVEATASTGGQIMPPIMGAAAFVMAEYLAVSYFQVTRLGVDPGAAVLRGALLRRALRGQARRADGRAAQRSCRAWGGDARARPPVHPDPDRAGRHVDVLLRAAVRPGRRARLPAGGAACAESHARGHHLAHGARGAARAAPSDALARGHGLRLRRHRHRRHLAHRAGHHLHAGRPRAGAEQPAAGARCSPRSPASCWAWACPRRRPTS